MLDQQFYGLSLYYWIVLGIASVGGGLLFWTILKLVKKGFASFSEKTEHKYDDYVLKLLEKTWLFSCISLAGVIAIQFLPFKVEDQPTWQSADSILQAVFLSILFIQGGRWVIAMRDVALEKTLKTATNEESNRKSAQTVVRFLVNCVIWSLVLLMILANLGIEITPLLTGLGVGGIIIGFALKEILSDIFCSVAIVFDSPFEVGDFIIVGDFLGTVEQIGIKTTRVRSLSGERIVFPNKDLVESRIRNYVDMEERRVVFNLGVEYSTPKEKVKEIPGLVKEIVEEQDQVRFDRAHMRSFGESSLDYEIVYYVLTKDYNVYMDIQQAINFGILDQFAEREISIAFPSRKLYVDTDARPFKAEVRSMPAETAASGNGKGE
ncbi:Low conductance mechanosensitive channel YnaI [Planctomycetales bacterium 10988]|nr:Low conductance mechanosensitive channel YnaI [Planctomycetales bacterium 10988]